MKLNLGSDTYRIPGFTNVDISPEAQPDILCDVTRMPMIETGTVEEIFASHILEHLPFDTPALHEWHRVLAPGGLITIAVPDIERALNILRCGGCSVEYFTSLIFGEARDGFRRPEYRHLQTFTESMLLSRVHGLFPDAVATRKMPYRAPVPQEVIVQGHKP